MAPFLDDLQRADAVPEQPPEGAMTYNEFVRSNSRDHEMSTLTRIVNDLLEMELRTQICRETIQADIVAGKTDLTNGHYNMICSERNASCQRIGFLLGHATAFQLDTEIVNRARSSFAGHHFGNQGQVNGMSGTNGINGVNRVEVNGNSASSGTSEATELDELTDSESPRMSSLETVANGAGETNGNHRGNGRAVETVTRAGNTVPATARSGNNRTSPEEESGETISPLGGIMVDIA